MTEKAPPTPDLVAARLQRHGFSLNETQAGHLTLYLGLLMQWNRRMNLVGTHTWEKTLDNLVLDSFHLARFLEQIQPLQKHNGEIWDLGAGAGLPGIPLRIVWQKGHYWLVESREKRALFLSTVLARLSLPRTCVFRGRAEEFMLNRSSSLILSRAFMPWPELLDLVSPYLSPGGRVVLLSNSSMEAPEGWVETGSMTYEATGMKDSSVRHIIGLERKGDN